MRKTLEEKRAARAERNATCKHDRQVVGERNGQRVQSCLSCKRQIGPSLGKVAKYVEGIGRYTDKQRADLGLPLRGVALRQPLSAESVSRLRSAGYPA